MTPDFYGIHKNNPSARQIINKAYEGAKKEGRYGGRRSEQFEELTGVQGDYKRPLDIEYEEKRLARAAKATPLEYDPNDPY